MSDGTIELKLPIERFKEVTEHAILEAMTPEERNSIIQQAVRNLLDRDTNRTYGHRGKSVVEDIFEDAARSCAREIIKGQLENDPVFQDSIKKLMEDVYKKVFEDQERRHELVETLARGFVHAFKVDD